MLTVEGYPRELRWMVSTFCPGGEAGLGGLEALAREGSAVLIRGGLVEDGIARDAVVFRRLRDGGLPGGLWGPVPRLWCALDLDGVAGLPAGPGAEGGVDWPAVSAVLPEPFRHSSFRWQLTSSHMVKGPELRARLWFWFNAPVDDRQLRAVDWGGLPIDLSLFNAVQPHYIANPQFTGLPDPVQVRWGRYQGTTNEVDARGLPVAPAQPPALVDYMAVRELCDLPAPNNVEIAARLEAIHASTTSSSRHRHGIGIACELLALGMEPERVEEEVEKCITRQGRDPQPGETAGILLHAVQKMMAGKMTVAHPPVAAVLDAADAAPPTKASPVDGLSIMASAPASFYGPNDWLNATTYKQDQYPNGGFMRWGEEDWEWTGAHWRRLDSDEVLPARIQNHTGLKDARAQATARSFRRLVLQERLSLNCAIPSGEPLPPIVVFSNGVLNLDEWLLDMSSGLHPHDMSRFVTSSLPYAYDPEAQCPRFMRFLEEVWPNSPEQRVEAQKLIGYMLLADNRFQKVFILMGRPRSGKGTLLRLIEALVGAENCCAPNLTSLADNFGLNPLVGRSVALIGEANQSGKIPDTAVDRIKSISGGDRVPVNRKNIGELHLRLPVKLVFACNRLPGFLDASGALASRLVLLTTFESFVGREDPGLDGKLAAELPGIAQWALRGLRRLLVEDGAFTPSEPVRRVLSEYRASQAPTQTFLQEALEFVEEAGEEAWIAKADVYAVYRAWCDENGHKPLAAARLWVEVNQEWPRMREVARERRVYVGDEGRPRQISHLRLTEEGRTLLSTHQRLHGVLPAGG